MHVQLSDPSNGVQQISLQVDRKAERTPQIRWQIDRSVDLMAFPVVANTKMNVLEMKSLDAGLLIAPDDVALLDP